MISEETFAKRVRKLRISKQLTQQQLGHELYTIKQNISNWEHGSSIPSLHMASHIANYFNVSLDYLVGHTDNPEINK